MESTIGFRFKVNCWFILQLKFNHMALKIIKGVWFLSLMAFLGAFMYIYASLPESVLLLEGDSAIELSRGAIFYGFLAIVGITNMLVFVVSRLFPADQIQFKTWFYGLVITLNLFFIVALAFINLYNSTEKFDYSNIGYVIYGSIALVAIWLASWPVYIVFKKNINKQAV
jgi:hypothetical protein